MAIHSEDLSAHKDLVRQQVWSRLSEVAIPDSHVHLDFSFLHS
jgi:hypothetical protein